jgi:hypothetical protein
MTKKTIPEIKNEPTVLNHLKTSSTYLRGHFWKQDEVSLKDIGFLLHYVPTKHSKEFVAKDIFDRCADSNDIYWTDVPEFKLIHSQPKITIAGRKNPLKTHAFSVQVLATEASNMNRFLQAIFATDHYYIPYNMKKTFPKAVAAGILAQNKRIKNTWVIVVVGIPRNVMPALESTIKESPGVIDISETNRTDQTGRWNILVNEPAFKPIRKRFNKNLQDWVCDLSPELQSTIPDTFPAPKVHQKNGYDDDDDDSSFGQASYMSSCAQSYASFDDNENHEQFHPPGKYNSYASALSSTLPTPAGTEVHVPDIRRTSSAASNTSADVQTTAYPTTIANLQHEVTIAQLQAEIQILKANLRGANTPSTVTEISTPMSNVPAPTKTDDRMATIETNMAILTAQFSSWMTELRQNDYVHGPPNHTVPPVQQQAIPNSEILEESSDTGTKHAIESPSHKSKRVDTRTTPTRADPMNIDESRVTLFLENAAAPNPEPRESPNSHLGNSHLHIPDHPYDSLRKQYTYQYNGDGTLFCSGQALPSDFIDGVIQGPRPRNSTHARDIWNDIPPELSLPHPPSVTRLHTQPEGTDLSASSDSPNSQRQPSPQRETLEIVTGSLSPSLLAEGAQIVHA